MSKHRKTDTPCENYIVLVDARGPLHAMHSTAGRYRVGANSEKEALKLVREAIGFGSANVYYKCKPEDRRVPRGIVMQEIPMQADPHMPWNRNFALVEPVHDTAPRTERR